jgi:hypothetical protein
MRAAFLHLLGAAGGALAMPPPVLLSVQRLFTVLFGQDPHRFFSEFDGRLSLAWSLVCAVGGSGQIATTPVFTVIVQHLFN